MIEIQKEGEVYIQWYVCMQVDYHEAFKQATDVYTRKRPNDADNACQLLQHLHQCNFEMVVITKSVATIAQSLLCETNSIDLSG